MTLVDAAIFGQRAGRLGGHRPHWIGLVLVSLLVALVIAGLVALIIWISRSRRTGHPVAAAPAPPVGASATTVAAVAPGRRPPHPRRAAGPGRHRPRRLPGPARSPRQLILHRGHPLPPVRSAP